MNDRNPDEILARLVPFASERDDSVGHDPAREALFTEITMTDIDTRSTRGTGAVPVRRPVWRRPGAALGAAAAATLLVVGGLAAVGERGGSSAHAQVIAAAEALAERDSGTVDVVIDVRSFIEEGVDDPGTLSMRYAFDGDDHVLTMDIEAATLEGQIDIEYREVDGVTYWSSEEPGRWVELPDDADPTGSFAANFADDLGFSRSNLEPEVIVDLVRSASDVREVSSEDGSVTYSATVSSATLEAIPADRLPAGISFLAVTGPAFGEPGVPPGFLPDEVDVTVTVSDGLVRTLRLDAVGEFPGSGNAGGGSIDATISVVFGTGPVPAIEAPPADLVDPVDTAFGLNSEMAEAIELLSSEGALELCMTDDLLESDFVDDAFMDAVASCLDENFGPEMADAWRTLNAQSPGLGPDGGPAGESGEG
ncbi:MAG: hypothetical protein ACE367_23145 [Acidimicrobiales bacterium]